MVKTGFCLRDFGQTNEQLRRFKEQPISKLHGEVESIQTRARTCRPFREPRNRFPAWRGRYDNPTYRTHPPEPVFLNVYGAQKSIPRDQFRQPM